MGRTLIVVTVVFAAAILALVINAVVVDAQKIVMINGAGHSPMVEKPEETLAAIRDFIGSQPHD